MKEDNKIVDFRSITSNINCMVSKTQSKVNMECLATIQVSKTGSNNLYENFAVVNVDGDFYCISYDSKLPNGKDIINYSSGCYYDFYLKEVSKIDVEIILEGVSWYKSNRGLNLNPYTVLFTYCSLHGLDLIKSGYLE